MKRTLAAVVFAAALVSFPMGVIAEDKVAASEEGAKPQAADADALWKQIEEAKPPEMDASKRRDQAYVTRYFEQRQENARKRAELTKQFVERYPDHPKKADALYMRAGALVQTRQLGEEFQNAVNAFVQVAPTDDRGATLLYQLGGRERDEAKRAKLLRQIVENYPTSDAGKRARSMLRQSEGVGKPFELSFTELTSGKTISMADLKGKVVVIDFWATWCGPCVAEMPEMKKLYAEYKDKGVEFIGVSLDAPEDQGGLKKLKDFVAQNDITWPQYYQGKGWEGEFSRGWGINSIPAVFVIDADGNLHSTKARGQLERLIPELLKKAGKNVS